MRKTQIVILSLLFMLFSCKKDDDQAQTGNPLSTDNKTNAVYLDSNGITIKSKNWAVVGDTGTINGTLYTVVSEIQLRDLIQNDSNVTNICVSLVKDMSNLFEHKKYFNQPIGNWDVENVTDMSWMFTNNKLFNQSIQNWDVSNVTDMNHMFGFSVFNSAIGNWDVSNVTDMSNMFFLNSKFNQDIKNWDVGSVTTMRRMFAACPFNQELKSWDVSNVTNTSEMFYSSDFNKDIGDWDVINVLTMSYMFKDNTTFNFDLSNWSVSNCNDCIDFNSGATSFILPKPNFTNCTP